MTKQYTRKFTAGGIVTVVEEPESGTSKAGKAWRKQVLIVDTGSEKYPNPIKVTFWNDKVTKTMGIRPNDEVEFDFYLRGSEYNDRFKVELNGDDVRINAKAPEAPDGDEEEQDAGADGTVDYGEVADDMPF